MVTLPTYESAKVETLSLTGSQVANYNVSGSTLTADPLPVTITSNIQLALTYTFTITQESERSLPLAPALPFTNVTGDLAGTGQVDRYWNLTLNTNQATAPTGVSLFGYFFITPGLWTSAAGPPQAADAIEMIAGGVSPILTSSSLWVTNATSGLIDLVWPIDFAFAQVTTAGTTLLQSYNRIIRDVLWNGRLQFALATSGADVIISGATLAGLTHKFHTGRMGLDKFRKARAVHDYKTGEPYLSDEAVEDGFLDNVMVHPGNFDPADPTDRHPYIPPPNEGLVDDDIIDLES